MAKDTWKNTKEGDIKGIHHIINTFNEMH
jgi:hypothetical protein